VVGKPEKKRPFRRPRHRYEDNTMGFREVGWKDTDWIDLSQERERWWAFVNEVMNIRVPKRFEEFSI
jgi:hypothetical protein